MALIYLKLYKWNCLFTHMHVLKILSVLNISNLFMQLFTFFFCRLFRTALLDLLLLLLHYYYYHHHYYNNLEF